jgi:transcriptional regulator
LLLTVDSKAVMLSMPDNKEGPMAPRTDRLQGNLELLVLRTLQREPMHGWAIAQRLEAISRSVLQVGQGSIYPALGRLEDEGWIRAEWAVSELGRKARYYRITPAGRRQLERERLRWEEFAAAVSRVLELA